MERKQISLIIAVVLLVSIVAGYSKSRQIQQRSNNQTTRTAEDAVTMIQSQDYDDLASQDSVFVLDVHTPEQQHLPNTNAFIPFDKLEQNQDKLPKDKNTPILVYCRSGGMSSIASKMLVKMGYKKVYDLEGGVRAYRESHTQVSITPKTHDFGRVLYGDIPTTTFKLTNNTPSDLNITRVSTSCSCTKAKLAKNTLKPGESADIEVSFNPAIHKDDTDLGALTRTIFIETDNPNFPKVTAEITAFVYKNKDK